MHRSILAEDSLAYAVYRLARLLRAHFNGLAAREGSDLTQEQWLTLNKLARRGELSQTELGDEVFGDRANLTRMLAVLEGRRYVARRADDEDGRKVRVRITPRGRAAHDAFWASVASERKRVFEGITDEELAVAKRVLARVEANLLKSG